MRTITAAVRWVLVLTAVAPAATRGGDETNSRDTPAASATGAGADWVALPIRVEGLPPRLSFVPVTARLNLTDAALKAGLPGGVDDRSLRLERLSDGYAEEVPAQWHADPQPRAKSRALLPGTNPQVSSLQEVPAGTDAGPVRTAGELTWIARGDAPGAGPARYRLVFAVPRAGSLVQVPFEPQDVKAFGADGRATPARPLAFPLMQVRPQWPLDGVVHLHDGRDSVASYRIGPLLADARSGTPGKVRRPFLYPVLGPDGDPLTELGKPHDPTGSHAHHDSLWVAHFKVDGLDFWGERGGVIAHERFDRRDDGPVFARVVQANRWVHEGRDRLRERRTLTLYHSPGAFRVLDVGLELTPPGDAPVTLGQTTFGFLAVRVAASMTVFDGGGAIENARGGLNERGAHLQKAEWIDQSGPIAPGRWAGVALLDHPDNPHFPTAWHCRDDGWAGAAFNADGPHAVRPGEPLRLRYRVVLHRGNAAEGEVSRRFSEFAAKPAVCVGEGARTDPPSER